MKPKLTHALLLVPLLILAGCSSSPKKPPKAVAQHHYEPIDSGSDDLIPVLAALHDQMHTWDGTPYEWGGTDQSGVDCSGFVCWVINNCGNGWNVGRTTANGLRGKCSYVSPANAQPGDLIFFEKTYNTVGASHVGIYVGNGMMIHCGDPISYTSINSTYWQNHFLGFGRIK